MLRTISFHRQEPHKKEATETACPLLGYKVQKQKQKQQQEQMRRL